jgi:hypothetical protein
MPLIRMLRDVAALIAKRLRHRSESGATVRLFAIMAQSGHARRRDHIRFWR